MNTRLLLFDLGGVLADLGDPVAAMRLDMAPDDFWSAWLRSSTVYSYEVGLMTTAEFCSRFGRELAYVDGEFTVERFRRWQLRLFPDAEQLLTRLSRSHRLGLLSNTNEVHWQQIASATQVFESFSATYLSYETGLYKPSSTSFQHVLQDLECSPSEVSYFDDTPENVAVAKSLGINGTCVRGAAELEEALRIEFGE